MARPKKKVDEALLEKLAMLHLSTKVMADCLNISTDTLERRYAAKIALFQSRSTSKIATVLFDEAINKRQSWAIKLLASKHLNYTDKVQHEVDSVKPFSLNYDTDKLKKKIT